MNDKLKLPLTAVFSFLLGGLVFFPWGSDGGILGVSKSIFNNVITFEQTEQANKQLTSTGSVAKKDTIIVKKVEYHFSGYDIALSNLAIKNQLNKSNDRKSDVNSESVQDNNNLLSVVSVKKVDYQFSKDELKLSNLAIKKYLRNPALAVKSQPDSPATTIPEKIAGMTETIITKPIIIVEYRFSSDELKVSNLKIKEQLKRYRISTAKNKEKLIVKKVNYSFDSEALLLSNSIIEKQLSRYLGDNTIDEPKIDHKTNIAEVEVAEKSETDLFVNNVSDYANESDSNDIHDTENDEKKYSKPVFSGAAIKLSNLAIAKQLRSYDDGASNKNESDVVTSSVNIEPEPEKIIESNSVAATEKILNSAYDEEDESELLMSNSAHEDDDEEDYSSIPVKFTSKHQFRKNELSSINESDNINEHDEEDDDEEDFSSERVVFTNEPRFLTHNLDEISAIAIDGNIETPDVEDIKDTSTIEEVEIIEEFEINDDGKIISSSAD